MLSVYRSVKHVFSTTNTVGCLFSRSKIVLRGREHLEDVLYLWNKVTIQKVMDRPQPAPVVEVEEVQEAN